MRCVLLLLTLALASPSFAQVAYFDDPTDTIQVQGQTAIGSASTYEAVVLFPDGTDPSAGDWLIFTEHTVGVENKMLAVRTTLVAGYSFFVAGNSAIAALASLAPNVWHHIAYVYDGTEERVYINGSLISSRPASGDVADGGGLPYMGALVREGDGLRTSINGYLESLRVSDVARYSGSSFEAPTGDLPSDANTLLLFNFTEDAGSATVQDASPMALLGTLGVGFDGATSPELGAVVPVASESGAETASMALATPSPNPARGLVELTFDLAVAGPVRLSIHDALGREVAVPVEGVRQLGTHTVALATDGLAPGIYVIRLVAGDALAIKRLTVVR